MIEEANLLDEYNLFIYYASEDWVNFDKVLERINRYPEEKRFRPEIIEKSSHQIQ